jgi:hypothetical protein
MTPWIKMRTDLYDDPRVRFIAKTLKCHVVSVIGSLYTLWALADQHSTDGSLWTYTATDLDRRVGRDGFAQTLALKEVGWLLVEDDRLVVPRFEEHNGQSAKLRAGGAKRVKKHRDRFTDVTLQVLPEKRREEKNITPPNGDVPSVEKGKRKPPSGEHHEFVRIFCERWQKKYGVSYAFVEGKDGQHVKWILGQCNRNLSESTRVIDAFFADSGWVAEKRHSLGILKSNFNEYHVAAVQKDDSMASQPTVRMAKS